MNSLFMDLSNKHSKDDFFLILIGVAIIGIIIVSFVFFPQESVKFGRFGRNQQFNESFAKEKEGPVEKTLNLRSEAREVKKKVTTDAQTGLSKILVENDEFKIDRQIENDSFSVTIKKAPYAESKKKAEDWFLAKGFTREDLCQLRIFFFAGLSLGWDFGPESQDLVPSGCPVQPLPKPQK